MHCSKTDAGEVRISAGAKNGHFALSVTDTGLGIPLDQQGRIFDQFHQVDSSNTRAKGGTGLGLVEMHVNLGRVQARSWHQISRAVSDASRVEGGCMMTNYRLPPIASLPGPR